jgi:hypothetical protein
MLQASVTESRRAPACTVEKRAMPGYRIYRLDKNGRIADADEVIDCDTDQQAIEKAIQMVNDHGIEVWQRARRVIELKSL